MTNSVAYTRSLAVLAALSATLAAATTAAAAVLDVNETVLASANSLGQTANASAYWPRLAAKGRFVVFESSATNLALGDLPGTTDVFLRDLAAGTTTLASRSVAVTGMGGNDSSHESDVSANGRFVAFTSLASDLMTDDSNGTSDIFVFDREHESIERVSVSTAGEAANAGSEGPAIAANGRFVAFASLATNLVPDDTNGKDDVFVHDRKSGKTERVSVGPGGPGGEQANDRSWKPVISASGRYVAFYSLATNLDADAVSGDAPYGLFVHDRKTGVTRLASVSSTGAPVTDLYGIRPSISANGRFVTFIASDKSIVPEDTDSNFDVFVRDLKKGTTERASVGSGGVAADKSSYSGSISGNGRYVCFESDATNVVPGDTNATVDVFIHDRKLGVTVRGSLGLGGAQANDSCYAGCLSNDGRTLAFHSGASNLLATALSNAGNQVFARRW